MLELLIAATITAVLAGLMIAVVTNALTAWSRSHGTLTAESDARLALDQLTTDLQGALFRADGNTWVAADVQTTVPTTHGWDTTSAKTNSLQLASDTYALADCRFGLGGVWLRFVTARPSSSSTTAAPVAVGYQILHRNPAGSSGEAHYLLYRAEVTPANTFTAGYSVNSGSYAAADATIGAAGNLVRPPDTYFLADNVVDFGVRFYQRDSTGALTQLFPTSNGTLSYVANSAATLPDVAEVMLRVLTADGQKLLSAYEATPANFPGQDWWTIVLANSKVYTRRVELHAASF